MYDNFIFSLSSTLPIFFVMIIGYLLHRKDIINANFVKKANMLVFYVALPVKLFNDVLKTDFNEYFDIGFIIFIIIGTVLSILVAYVFGIFIVKDKRKLGTFVQGAFRGNFLYVGLTLMENVTGSIGAKAPLAIAIVIPLYNILAVFILSILNGSGKIKIDVKSIIKNIILNPLIIAVVLGIVGSQLNLELPFILSRTMSYFSIIATPIALIAIGASFDFKQLLKNSMSAFVASTLKLIIIPAIAVTAAVALGFKSEDILLIFILFGVPTAASSYVMTVMMDGDGDLASNIIMVSTLLSNFTLTLFIFIFKVLKYI